MAALIEAGKIRHYGLSNETAWGVCEFQRVARELGVPGPVTIQNSYSLRVAQRRQRPRRGAVSRKDVAARLQPARRRDAVGKVSGRRASRRRSRFTLFDNFGLRFRKPHGAPRRSTPTRRSPKQRGITLVRAALGYVNSRWYRRRIDHRRDDDGAARRKTSPRRNGAHADTLAAIAAVQVNFPSPAG